MKLKNLLKICNDMLSLGISAAYFEQSAMPEDERIQKLCNCFAFVQEEIFREYGGAVRTVAVTAAEGKVDLSLLNVCKVISLSDAEGNSLPFRYSDNALFVGSNGQLNMCYMRLPDPVSWDDEVVLPVHVTERMAVYGVAKEYFAAIGDWFTSRQWDERFKNALRVACGKTSSLHMPQRGWM